MDKHYLIFRQMLEGYINNKTSKEEINAILINEVDVELVLNTEDTLLNDMYFSLLHYSIGEEEFTVKEAYYFLECLSGIRKHSFEDKC